MNLRKLSLVLTIFLVLVSAFAIYQVIDRQNEVIQELTRLSEAQREHIAQLDSKLNTTREALRDEQNLTAGLTRELHELKHNFTGRYVMVGIDAEYKGVVIPLEVTIRNGSGNLYMDVTDILYDQSLQTTARTAVETASDITGVDTRDKDIFISVEAPFGHRVVEVTGGSSGAAMTIAVIAAMEERELSNEILITGTIEKHHVIGRVGGVKEKAVAAKQWGARGFVVPVGQGVSVPGLEVKEMFTIEDALEYIY